MYLCLFVKCFSDLFTNASTVSQFEADARLVKNNYIKVHIYGSSQPNPATFYDVNQVPFKGKVTSVQSFIEYCVDLIIMTCIKAHVINSNCPGNFYFRSWSL